MLTRHLDYEISCKKKSRITINRKERWENKAMDVSTYILSYIFFYKSLQVTTNRSSLSTLTSRLIQSKIWLYFINFCLFIKTMSFWFFLKKIDPNNLIKTRNLNLELNRLPGWVYKLCMMSLLMFYHIFSSTDHYKLQPILEAH
jgi:hypothetical protein